MSILGAACWKSAAWNERWRFKDMHGPKARRSAGFDSEVAGHIPHGLSLAEIVDIAPPPGLEQPGPPGGLAPGPLAARSASSAMPAAQGPHHPMALATAETADVAIDTLSNMCRFV